MNCKYSEIDNCARMPEAPGQEPVAGNGLVVPRVQRLSSQVLLNGANEVEIEHRGVLYRLRQTSLGKLILTK